MDFVPHLIVYDFDGVMTDNRVIVDEDGKESVCVHRGDGYAVRMIKDELKILQIILSTEVNPVVLRRAEKLKIPSIHGAGDEKKNILKQYCKEQKIELANVLYIGNDLNDFGAMQICGYCACPQDAEPEILEIANYIFSAKGGYGVVRELYRILKEKLR